MAQTFQQEHVANLYKWYLVSKTGNAPLRVLTSELPGKVEKKTSSPLPEMS